jgi:hypothetical protein
MRCAVLSRSLADDTLSVSDLTTQFSESICVATIAESSAIRVAMQNLDRKYFYLLIKEPDCLVQSRQLDFLRSLTAIRRKLSDVKGTGPRAHRGGQVEGCVSCLVPT